MAQLRKIWTAGARAAAVGPTRAPTRAGPGRHPGVRTGPVWGQSCPKNVTRKSTIEEFPAETPD
jgi:hypothetical protein